MKISFLATMAVLLLAGCAHHHPPPPPPPPCEGIACRVPTAWRGTECEYITAHPELFRDVEFCSDLEHSTIIPPDNGDHPPR